ncbi:MAG: ABC transporter permease subunit, partial [Clostridia bacterium]
RDRRTWISALLIPVLVIPTVFLLLDSTMNRVEREAREYIPFAVTGELDLAILAELEAIPGAARMQTDVPMEAIKRGDLRVWLEAQTAPVIGQNLTQARPQPLKIWYDPTNQKSKYALEAMTGVLERYAKRIVEERLAIAGIDSRRLAPIEFSAQSVASEGQVAGNLLGSIIPIVLLMALASGGMASAVDLVAGEKERGTMETLLATPVLPSQMLTAKLLVVMLMSIVSAVASLVSMGFIYSFQHEESAQAGMPPHLLQPEAIVLLGLMILLSAAMFAGLQLMLSAIARTNKEAQTYMSPVLFAAMVPSYMLMPLKPIDISLVMYVLPVFNNVALFKEIFTGQIVPLHAVAAVGSSVLYVASAIFAASWFFRNERFLVK